MLYIIGLGLGDESDVSVKGLEIIRKCDYVYLECYTSLLSCGTAKLTEFYGRPVVEMDRDAVETGCDEMLEQASSGKEVAFLVVGDAFSATTHSDLQIRARKMGIPVKPVFNASIMTAVGASGLQLYRFGQAISQVMWTDTWQPDSYYDKIRSNRSAGLHTLCLLDIKVKEPTLESLARGKPVFMPPRFMTSAEGAMQLLSIEDRRQEGCYDRSTMAVAFARMGTASEEIVAGTLEELSKMDMGAPLHTLVLCGDLHPMEAEALQFWRRSASP